MPPRAWMTSPAGLVAAAALALGACGSSPPAASSTVIPAAGPARARVAGGDWRTFDYTPSRSGVAPSRTGIGAGALHLLGRRVIHVDGVVDSSAVELHRVKVKGRRRDIAIVTTTYGRTIAFDPGTGQKLWQFTPSDIGSLIGAPQITTATPVIDPDRRYVYAASPDGFVHKLAVASGRQVRRGGWPVRVTDDAHREKIAGALNLEGGDVLVVTGGYIGDAPVYQGHVVAIGRRSGRIAHVWNSLCSDRRGLIAPPSVCGASDSAIWARAGTVVEPGSGRLLVATGNAPWNGRTDWGDSVLELAPDAAGLLQNWTPRNQAQLGHTDADIGSTAPALLPQTGGMRLAVQGGKAGILYLLDLDRLNGTAHAGPLLGGELQQIPSPQGDQVFTAPAVWSSGGRTLVFVADNSATAAYAFSGGAKPRLSVAWQVSAPGTSPLIAGGLLYVYDQIHGTLDVRDPRTGALRASLPAAPGHWNSPIVVGGRIVLPVGGSSADRDTSGTIYVYHLRGR